MIELSTPYLMAKKSVIPNVTHKLDNNYSGDGLGGIGGVGR